MIPERRHSWQRPGQFTPTSEQIELAQKFKVDVDLLHLLALRDIQSEKAIGKFLYPSLANLPDPFSMKDMQKAVRLIAEALTRHSDIVIWGDYDVDGVTATCLLMRFFTSLGKKARWYIPNRFSEGYGLNIQGIEKIRAGLTSEHPLLITVDCGISSTAEIKKARDLGFYTIITDHHSLPEAKIEADAILNVKQPGCTFSDKNLAGVSTAFYLAAGTRSHLNASGYFSPAQPAPNLKQFLDLVAIGSIADMVPLAGVNRTLVKSGFEILSRSENIGISALLRSSNIPSGAIVSDDIAFQLAPKINAAGRMGKVDASLELLLCSDTAKADKLADTLTSLNTKRKKVCADILEYTLNINTNQLIFNDNCIILSGEFHQGVIGIAASQLVKAHGLPVILFTRDLSIQGRSVLKGSGRSVAGVDLFALLCQCDRYILKYGGHPMAAGLSIFEENFEKFKRVFSKMLTASMTETAGLADSRIDMELSVEKFFEKGMAEQINRLEPFGVGNRRPVFLDRSATLYDYRLLGKKGDHLRLYFRCRHSNRQGMAFNLGHKKDILQAGGTRGIIYSPTLSRYNNSASWEIRILDIF